LIVLKGKTKDLYAIFKNISRRSHGFTQIKNGIIKCRAFYKASAKICEICGKPKILKNISRRSHGFTQIKKEFIDSNVNVLNIY
jgi:hypothetical protein